MEHSEIIFGSCWSLPETAVLIALKLNMSKIVPIKTLDLPKLSIVISYMCILILSLSTTTNLIFAF